MEIIKQIKDVVSKFYYIFTPKQRKGSYGLLFLLLLGSVFEMLGVSAIIPLVQVILMPDNLLQDDRVAWLWNLLHVSSARQLVLWVSAGTILVYVLKNLYMSFLSYYKNKFYRRVEKETSLRLMNSYLNREYTFHINTNSTILLRSIIYDINGVSAALMSVFTVIMECMSVVLIITVLIWTDWLTAMVLAVSALVALGIIVKIFYKKMQVEGQSAIKYSHLCLQTVNEAFNGIKDVMVTRRQSFFADNYNVAVTEKNKSNAVKNFASECPAYVIEAVCITTFILMLCVKSLAGQNGSEFISQAAAFAVAAFRILPSVGKVTNNYNVIVFYQAVLNDVYKNISEVNQFDREIQTFSEIGSGDGTIRIQENEHAEKESKMKADKFKDSITLENVSWKYPNAEHKVIDNLNMSIHKGEAVGFIGASGAGKTTLADMILGLLPAQSGRICMDGTDIKLIPDLWSKTIGYVPQSVYLTDDTIRSNVAFGIKREQIDDKAVWEALEQAQLKSFVQSLPKGLDTIVGERGIKFSGGQRQRVAIARALYYDPAILVLDEATSALDNETESAVMEAIESLQGHKTLIIVAHRLTTIQSCNHVYEIVDGKAVLQKGFGKPL